MMLSQKLARIQEKRVQSPPLPKGVSPATSSTWYKTQDEGDKPSAKACDHRLSEEGRSLVPSKMKQSATTINPPHTITLGVARPSAQLFPWTSMATVAVNDLHQGALNGSGTVVDTSCERGEDAFNFDVAMNYGFTAGAPQILRYFTEHVELIHDPPYADWEMSMTCGATSSLEIMFRILCERGDWILADKYTYSGTIDAAKLQGIKIQGVEMDMLGMCPDDLERKLRDWDPVHGKRPSVLYLIPSGHNPTGTTQDTTRRRMIYEIAERYDLCIIEDDPYFYLQLGGNASNNGPRIDRNWTPDEYVKHLPLSYLSLDRSGRVVRLDTTSKILAPGLRVGWITACRRLIELFKAFTDLSTVFPSGPSQVMLYKLLDETWGHMGFVTWLMSLSLKLLERFRTLDDAFKRYLPAGICQWDVPEVGMFLWMKLDLCKHPRMKSDLSQQDIWNLHLDIEDRICTAAKRNGVVVAKGSWFATKDADVADLRLRLTFAAAPEQDLAEAARLFGETLYTEFDCNTIERSQPISNSSNMSKHEMTGISIATLEVSE